MSVMDGLYRVATFHPTRATDVFAVSKDLGMLATGHQAMSAVLTPGAESELPVDPCSVA